MKRHWKKETQAEALRRVGHTCKPDCDCRQRYTLSTEGIIGRNYRCDNTHEIEAVFHYNGSGDKAFGGARSWPVVTLKVAFQEGRIKERDAFVEKLRAWLDENLP